ncbi:MAG: M24 family metallopeptidase [Haloferacaceae archaeon]
MSGRPTVVASALADADARAFVHVGDRSDPTLRYLVGFDGPASEFAYVHVDHPVVCVPPAYEGRARQSLDGVDVRALDGPAGLAARTVLDDALDPPCAVLTPRHLPHDAAVYLESGGYDLASTTAVGDARAVKSEAELARHRAAQSGAERAMAAVAEALSTADRAADELHADGDPLTPERLRRVANVAIAEAGLADDGNTVIRRRAGAASAPIRPTELLTVAVAPRDPAGYHGVLARTFVAESDGGWERRAAVAVDASRRVGVDTADPGTDARFVREEATAELGSFGLSPVAAVPELPVVARGVGLSLDESPDFDSEAPLDPGNVFALAPAVSGERGVVGTADLAVVGDDGAELVGSFPTSLSP